MARTTQSDATESLLSALDEMLTASGEGLVAFDDAGNVIFSTRLADEILDIRTEGGRAQMGAQLMSVAKEQPLSLFDLAARNPAVARAKTSRGERVIRLNGLPARRIFMVSDAAVEMRRCEEDQKLLDIVAHDLRGGLVSAKTYTQMLLSSVFGKLSDKQTDAARVIEAGILKQEDRISNVLDMVKAAENRLELQLEPVSLLDVVRQAAASLERDARRKNVALNLDLDPAAALVQADAPRLQRTLVNLLNRCLKQSAQGRAMGVELRYPEEGRARLRVWDCGAGISPDDLEVLTRSQQDRVYAGSGDEAAANIDLAAVFDILRAHQGVLNVQTESGAGTTFTLYLPVRQKAGAGASRWPDGTVLAVLIAGASLEERAALEGAGRDKKFEMVLAETGKDAICLCRARHFPLVFLSDRIADCDLAAVAAAVRLQRPEDPQAVCIIHHDGKAEYDASVINWNVGTAPDAPDAGRVLSELLAGLKA